MSQVLQSGMSMEWVNAELESGQPYDIRLVPASGDEGGAIYIEVKSTRTADRNAFEISPAELRMAMKKGTRCGGVT